MDPVLILVEWWWTVPAVAAAGTAGALGVVGVRRRDRRSGRRLAVDAARHDLRISQQRVAERRVAVKAARAEHARIAAERGARRASIEQVAAAKRMLRERERELRAAHADVKATQLRLSAERAAIPPAAGPRPLERLRAQHESITARWMRYETDAALQIAYPAMTDVRQPATAAYLRAAGRATELRRVAEYAPTPQAYSAYRDAVAELERSLDEAEHRARVQAGEAPATAWQDAAHDVLTRSAEALDRAAGAAASAIAAWSSRYRSRGDER